MIAQGRGGRIIGKAARRCLVYGTNHYLARFHIGACSLAGKQAAASHSAYSASKFGIRALTQTAGASRLTLLSSSLPALFEC